MRIKLFFSMLILSFFVASCGQSGKLYLPYAQKKEQTDHP